MKNILKSIFSAVSCALVMGCSTIGAFAAVDNSAAGFDGDTSNCGVYDHKGLFDPDELETLDQKVREVSDELDMYIAIYLSDDAMSEYQTEVFADEDRKSVV